MGNVGSILASLVIVGLLAYLARLARRHLRHSGHQRTRTEEEALSQAEYQTRSRLPF